MIKFSNRDTLGIRPQQAQTPTEALMGAVSNLKEQNSGHHVDAGTTKGILGIESMSVEVAGRADESAGRIQENLTKAIAATNLQLKNEGRGTMEFGAASLEAATYAMMAASNPRALAARGNFDPTGVRSAAEQEKATYVAMNSTGVRGKRPVVGAEAFDNRVNNTIIERAVTYNLKGPRQNEFAATFFPPVAIAPGQAAWSTSIQVQYVFEPVKHAVNGAVADFHRVSLLKALRKSDILRSEVTKVIPVLRTGGGESDTTHLFSSKVAPVNVMYENHPVPTAPLAFGVGEFNLLGLSQNDALIQQGVFTHSDSLDSAAYFEEIFIELGANAGGKVLRFPVKDLRGTHFTYSLQGNTRTLSIQSKIYDLWLKKDMLDHLGAAIPGLNGLGTNQVRVSMSVYGTILQDKGTTDINAGKLVVEEIRTADGEKLDLKSSQGATIVTLLEGTKGDSYRVNIRRTNSNLRENGQRIDTQTEVNVYYVPTLAPITAQRPVLQDGSDDGALMDTLCQTTYVNASNHAVDRLFEIADTLKTYTANRGVESQAQMLGVVSYLIEPTYLEDEWKIDEMVDSLNSSDRANNTMDAFLNGVRDFAYRMWTESGLQLALEAAYGTCPKPVVIIGCDPLYKRWLTEFGDNRMMGEFFGHRVVDSWNEKMSGHLFITFGLEEAFSSGVQCPWHFGNFVWRAEVPVAMPITRGNATTHELMVTPSYLHVPNLPVLAKIKVSGIEKIIAAKNPVWTKAV